MEANLEITTENIEDLIELGIPCIEGNELICEVTYDINRADPDVGIMTDNVEITSVTYNGTGVERFFDMDKLQALAAQDLDDTRADHECQAAEWEMDRMRGL